MALSFTFRLLKWGYEENNGPNNWSQWFPVAVEGSRQSPVNIVTSEVSSDPGLSDLVAKYEETSSANLENTGKSFQVHFQDPLFSSLTGGPLTGEYRVVQLHAHWGHQSGHGSEHTIDGRSYDAELHIVHYNTKYDNPGAALDQEDGLAVLGIFLSVGQEDHAEFEKICKRFSEIQNASEIVPLEESLDLNKLIPDDRQYFTYPGSLTTPPLYESVSWIVFKKEIKLSQRQFDMLRSMKTGKGKPKPLVNNFRPPCDKKSRNIKMCC